MHDSFGLFKRDINEYICGSSFLCQWIDRTCSEITVHNGVPNEGHIAEIKHFKD